jgi:hypothetical protein
MVSHLIVEPEVAGGWGPNTVCRREPGKPVEVLKLHYRFDGWLGDELLESTPCFIVTEQLTQEIRKARLTGVRFDIVEVSTSEQFRDLYPDRQLPKFVWLRVDGHPGLEDFGVAPGMTLVVSVPALETLQRRGIAHATVRTYEAGPG